MNRGWKILCASYAASAGYLRRIWRRAGVSRQTIISIKKGRHAPNLALAFTLADIFDTSIESMFTPGA